MNEPTHCERCGTPLPGDAHFCRRCGLAVARSQSPMLTPRVKARCGGRWVTGMGLFMFLGFFGFFHVGHVQQEIPAAPALRVDDNYYQPVRDRRTPNTVERRRINRQDNQQYFYRQN